MDLNDSTLDVFAELAAAAQELPESAGHRHNSDTDSSSLISRDSLTYLSSSDSEENQGEDDDDDKENVQPKKGKRTIHKEIHNVCERRRRENMREAFASLQKKIYPDGCSGPRLSKMDLLKGAVEKIERVKKELLVLEAEAARRNIVC